MDYTGKKFSFMGDSISTYKGVTVTDPNTFYGREMIRKGGFAGVEDTWWMRLAAALGGVMEADNAFSGSCVTDGYGLGRGACTMERVGALGDPDVICIFMGANDRGFGVPAAEFAAAYGLLLARLKETYPRAEIWCATMVNGIKVLEDEPFFMGEDPFTPPEPFSSIVREQAEKAGVRVADLARYDVRYDAIDGCHPTSGGMAQIAELWRREMTGIE